MKPIIPNFWFDTQSEEAVAFYKTVFPNVAVGHVMHYDQASAEVSGQKEGSVLTVEFSIDGQPFIALNGGPSFQINPSISFFVRCNTEQEIDAMWEKLADGGQALMELGEYPFSKRYGWIQDKYGVSWQLNLQEGTQRIVPSLLFTKENHGRAQEAMDLYVSVFPNSAFVTSMKRTADQAVHGEKEGTIAYGLLTILGKEFVVMESGGPHNFSFNEGVSLMIECDTQEEIDRLWNALIADGGEESMCGWLKDKFGVSWQIAPTQLNDMIQDPDNEKASRAMKAMLTMRKLDIAGLQAAYDGR